MSDTLHVHTTLKDAAGYLRFAPGAVLLVNDVLLQVTKCNGARVILEPLPRHLADTLERAMRAEHEEKAAHGGT